MWQRRAKPTAPTSTGWQIDTHERLYRWDKLTVPWDGITVVEGWLHPILIEFDTVLRLWFRDRDGHLQWVSTAEGDANYYALEKDLRERLAVSDDQFGQLLARASDNRANELPPLVLWARDPD